MIFPAFFRCWRKREVHVIKKQIVNFTCIKLKCLCVCVCVGEREGGWVFGSGVPQPHRFLDMCLCEVE